MSSPQISTSRRTFIGAGWLIGARLSARALDFAGLLVLARFLTPADFGFVAIGMTLVQLMEAILELPVGQVLVRSAAVTPRLLDTAFTLSLGRGVLLSIVLVLASFPFAQVYRDPRLVGLICFLSLAPALRSMVSPRMVVFARAIDFRREVGLELTSKAIALCVSAAAAYETGSYWAIAAGTVCGPAILALGSYVLAPYRPALSLAEWRIFGSFLGWTTAAQAVTAINWQSDRPILGLFVSPSLLGTYSVANDLSLIPEQALVKPVYRPLLSAFAGIQEDHQRLSRAYLRTAHLILSAGTPVMITLAFLALPATRLALGGKWLAAAPIVQWLSLTLIIPLFSAPMGPLAVSLGKTHIFFRQSVVELVLRLPITVLLSYQLGVPGLLVARLITSVVNTLTSMYYVKTLVGLGFTAQLALGWRPVLAGLTMGGTLLALRPFLVNLSQVTLALGLSYCAAAGFTVYVLVMLGLWLTTDRSGGVEEVVTRWISAQLGRLRRGSPLDGPGRARRKPR